MQNSQNKIFYKLTSNFGEGLYNLSLWFPLFASCWLVSGFIINKLAIFSYFFIPLILFFIFYNSKEQLDKTIAEKKYYLIFIVVIALLYSAYMQYTFNKSELTTAFVFTMSAFILDWLYAPSSVISISKVLIKAAVPLIVLSCFSILGIFSQYDEVFREKHLIYLVLGIIPGLVLTSRNFLLYSKVFENRGWEYEGTVKKADKEIVRPKGISRLIIGTMILGPAVPSLMMPFNVIPQSMFVVSLSFLFVPKLAQKIQTRSGSLEERVVLVTAFAFIVEILTFAGATLAI